MILENSALSNDKKKTQFFVSKYQEATERSLVEAAKAGHSTAFAALYERNAQQLLSVALRITRNREDSEDAVQDALMRAFVHVQDFDGRSSFATWLTRIAINSALMILRKKRSSQETSMVDTDDSGEERLFHQIPDRAPNPERRYARNEEEQILRKAVHQLRAPLRDVVEIQQLQERSMRETAAAMCISVSAAKARLFHAKAALRKSPVLKRCQQPRCGDVFRVLSAA